MPEIRLSGCRSRPLVNYLKALGVMRVVSQQADPDARIRWRGRVAELRSELDEDGLRRLFLDTYRPAPVVSPWNGGSGFFPGDRQIAMEQIDGSDDTRLGPYRDAIASARACLDSLKLTEKPPLDLKALLVRRLRRTAPDEAVNWIDAAVITRGDQFTGAPLLGTGGNDGRFDFSNNYAQCVVESILPGPNATSEANLTAALWQSTPKLRSKLSLGHFSRDSSPTNSPNGESDSLGNPWDLILSLEGSLLISAGAARRHNAHLRPQAVAPFSVRPTGAGYGSAVEGESVRAELWLPLWADWVSRAEFEALAREFRAQVSDGSFVRRAATGLDLARAVGERGVASGISEFERIALAERAGQSTLAVPVGRIAVKPRPGPTALKDIDRWLRNAIAFGEGEHCPGGPRRSIAHLKEAVFAMSTAGDDDPGAVCALLEALAEVEASLVRSSSAMGSAQVSPVPSPPAGPWISIADDGSPEFAIALAIGSLHESPHADRSLPRVRDYLFGTQGNGARTTFDQKRRHAVPGGSAIEVLAALHAHRHLDAARAGLTPGHLGFAAGAPAPLESLRLFVTDGLDDDRILALARGLSLLRHRHDDPAPRPESADSSPPFPTFEVLALAWRSGWKRSSSTSQNQPGANTGAIAATDDAESQTANPDGLGARPGWAARLAARSARPVIADAHLRLRMAGLPPCSTVGDLLVAVEGGSSRADLAWRLSAALLPRMRPGDLRRLEKSQILEDENDKTKDEE